MTTDTIAMMLKTLSDDDLRAELRRRGAVPPDNVARWLLPEPVRVQQTGPIPKWLQNARLFNDLAAAQTRLPPDFEKVWSDNIEDLYQS